MEPCRWSLDYSLWIIVRGALRSPQGPCAARALSPDRFLGLSDVRWASCAGEGACAGESLERCRDPRQLGQSPEGAEDQPGPASGMSFFTLKNFLLSPLFFKSVYISVDLQSVYTSVLLLLRIRKAAPLPPSWLMAAVSPSLGATLGFSMFFLAWLTGSHDALPSCCQMLLRWDGRSWHGSDTPREPLLALVSTGHSSWCCVLPTPPDG